MKRMKTFDVPHKGLRNALSQFTLMAGKTNYADARQVSALYQFGKAVFSILAIHAKDENEVTLKHLEEKSPGASRHDVQDHEQIELRQQELENSLQQLYENAVSGMDAGIEGDAFYQHLNDFHALYLLHMAEEERETQALLWKYFSDEELMAHRGEIIARNPPETLLTWFRFVLPAQSHFERIALLKGFRRNAPEPFFNQGMEVISSVLTENEFKELQAALT